ncbi:MAG: hypothetical protein JW919_05890, partial [Candidatus Omnitrophica bacterium]|nr:hypothetical protein [Candidatus Omnitrophota bacterium]
EPDGSVLMAAPVCGYAAYSQLYASLIEQIWFLGRKNKDVMEMAGDEEVRQITERMALVLKEITRSEDDASRIQARILELVPGISSIAAGIGSGEDAASLIEKFLQTYITQHCWNLPYAKAVDWNQVREFFEAQKRALEAA